jgi:hypothetical protein
MVAAQKLYLACLCRLLNNSGPNRQRYILEAQRGKKYSKIGIKFFPVISFIISLCEDGYQSGRILNRILLK